MESVESEKGVKMERAAENNVQEPDETDMVHFDDLDEIIPRKAD